MGKVFHGFVAFCAASNFIGDAWNWWHGEPATWWVWFACLLFSVGVFFDCLERLTRDKRDVWR